MEKFIPYEKLSKKKRRALNAKRREVWLISPITRKPEMNDIKPYCFGVIELPEGPAVNAMVRGVDKKNKDLVAAKLPIDVHMVIIPRDGYDTVIFELDEIPKPEK